MKIDARTGRKVYDQDRFAPKHTNWGPENWGELLVAFESQKEEADRLRARVQQLEATTGFKPVHDGFTVVNEDYQLLVSGERLSVWKGSRLISFWDLPDDLRLSKKRD